MVTGVLGQALSGGPRDILDIGGGTGVHAVRLAEEGHRVTVVDPSPDALAALSRRAREAGVEVDGRQGDLSTLADVVATSGYDLVLCHGVLEVLGDSGSQTPADALASLRTTLRPEGHLSLLVGQRSAAVVARAMAGSFGRAKELLEQPVGVRAAGERFSESEVRALLDGAGYTLSSVHAVRVFADLVPGALLEAEPGAARGLLELEQSVSSRPEYFPLASQLHFLARPR